MITENEFSELPIEHWIEHMREIAWKAHKGQTRNDGSPYIHHPERVAAAVEPRLKDINDHPSEHAKQKYIKALAFFGVT